MVKDKMGNTHTHTHTDKYILYVHEFASASTAENCFMIDTLLSVVKRLN